jgi:threonine dehydratase
MVVIVHVGAGGGVTVRVVLPERLPEVAVIVVEPAATDVASPALLMVATAVFEELHVTDEMMSLVLLSE